VTQILPEIDLTDLENFTPVPDGKLPLFGDCFDGLSPEEQ
jgi:hypothetical protein